MMPFDQQIADAIERCMREKMASFETACRHEGVSIHEARDWRRLGLFGDHKAALRFHNAVLRQEAEVIAKAEKTLVDLATGKRKAGGTRREARGHNTQLHAAQWLLEKRCPERYGKTKQDELHRLRQQAAEDLLGFLQRKLPESAFRELLDVLAAPMEPALEAGDSDE